MKCNPVSTGKWQGRPENLWNWKTVVVRQGVKAVPWQDDLGVSSV
jgi:hypothetical protein